jgi:hypothetical protein
MWPKPYLRDLRAAAQELQNELGEWVIAGVETSVAWPKISQVIEFDGLDFILRAGDERSEPAILLNARMHALNRKEAQDRILKLASALAWEHGSKLEIYMWLSGSRPFGVGKSKGSVIQDFMEADRLPSHEDEGAWIALALFREGLSINNPFYAFLSFFKSISTIHRNGIERQKWFQYALPQIKDDQVKERIAELAEANVDVATYLYDEGRNAIAHAEKEIFVNPDRMIDYERIQKDLPVLRNLAKFAIEERYELFSRFSGYGRIKSNINLFEAALGADLINKIIRDIPLDGKETVQFPDSVSIVARHLAETHAFFEMKFIHLSFIPNGVRILITDKEEYVRFFFNLDLVKHELHFDPLKDMERVIDLTNQKGIEIEINFLEFRWAIFLNGRLEVWDDSTNQLMGKTDAYVPLNMFADLEAHQEQIAKLVAKRDLCKALQ